MGSKDQAKSTLSGDVFAALQKLAISNTSVGGWLGSRFKLLSYPPGLTDIE